MANKFSKIGVYLINDRNEKSQYSKNQNLFHNELKKQLESLGYKQSENLQLQVKHSENGYFGKNIQQHFYGMFDVIIANSDIEPRGYFNEGKDFDALINIYSLSQSKEILDSTKQKLEEIIDNIKINF